VSRPPRTHVWHIFALTEPTPTVDLGSRRHKLAVGEGFTRCRMISTADRPLVGTFSPDLADCRGCEAELKRLRA
jgi:hypothetical protein